MKTIINLFIIVMAIYLFPFDAFSSHYMGGEITWECLPNGKYRFHLRYYRECAGILYPNSVTLISNSPAGNITMNLYPNTTAGKTDISPVCNSNPAFPHITCATVTGSNQGAVQEWYYTSDAAYPNGVTLNGIPPATGWYFYHGSCCRNPCTNIINSSSISWRLQAVMYPYNNQNANPCYDNSPTFAEKPATVICTGYPFTYNHFAEDKELDSLAFEWAPPLDQNGNQITAYAFGYSYTSPLPGTMQNPNNVPATVNPFTGEISFTSYTQGAFVTKTKVTAYKCGIKVAEIFREMQVVLLTCGINNPPNVTPPFQNPVTGLYTDYMDTVYAGDFVSFPMSATDFEFLPNGIPQTIKILATGAQFGTNFTTIGCINPPCASLTPPPPVVGQFGVQTTFNWQTGCNHLATPAGCGTTSNLYNFLIKVSDDFCPAPAIKIASVSILVLDQPQLPPPELRCIAVNPSGDITLNWIPVVDTNQSFKSYRIFRSDSLNGTYIPADSIFSINQSSWTDNNVNGQVQEYYYYIKTQSGCFGDYLSAPGDTLQSMMMNVSNTGNGTALLTWNPIHDPNLPTSTGQYLIYREYPPGQFALIDSTIYVTYEDTITLCNEFVNYRVEIYDSSGCKSVSSVDGDWFQDLIAPAIPIIDTVSVDAVSDKAVIGWKKSTSPDTQGYIIYTLISGIWTTIDTLWGINNTFYIDASSSPDLQSISYSIAAFDSCGNTSTLSPEHRTIYLTGILAICDYEIRLSWNSYINMDPSIEGYHIFVSENGSPYTLLATLSANDTSYLHNGLTKDSEYCYFIQAYNNSDETSSSNVFCEIAHQPYQPQFIYLRYATVENNDRIALLCFVDTSAYVQHYKLYRSADPAGPFELLAIIPPGSSDHIFYTDISAMVHDVSYYYYFSVVDSCGVEVLESNITRTILLEGEKVDNFNNKIWWNNYEGWPGGVGSYIISRSIDNHAFSPLISLPPSVINSYQDHIITETESGGLFRYYVESQEAFMNQYGFQDKSMSNNVAINQPPRVFIPNAFLPKGYNNRFYPIAIFVKSDDYLFRITNRWGEIIFESRNTNEGWDGRYKGDYVPSGVYIFYIRFKTSGGDYFEKFGTVTVIY